MNNKVILLVVVVVGIIVGVWFSKKSSTPEVVNPDAPVVDGISPAGNSNESSQAAGSTPPTVISGAQGSAGSNQQSVSGSGKSGDLNQFLARYDSKSKWRINRTDDNRVIAFSGGMIEGISDSEMKELAFAKEFAETTGVPGDQIIQSETKLEQTPYTEVRQYDQEVGGYLVLGGYMKVFHRKSDGAIYYVANETRNVGDVDLRIRYSFADAKATVLQRFAGKTGVVVENNPSRPVIFSERAGHGELAWETLVRIQGPLYDYRHVLVSAISGQILKDITLIKN